jgi:pentatricopeptide repeat protein
MYALGLDNSIIYNYLITAYIMYKKSDEALKWVKRLKKRHGVFNTTSYRNVLGLYCDMGDYEKAFDFISEQTSHAPTSDIMIKILKGSEEDPEIFKDYLEVFENHPWDFYLFRYLITFYSSQRDIKKAWLILEKYCALLEEKGGKINVKIVYPIRDLMVLEKRHLYLQELFMVCKRLGVDQRLFLKINSGSSNMTSKDIVFLNDVIGRIENK